MSGYAFYMSACIACEQIFTYNPHWVPSSSAITGKREPICRTCMHQLNEKRKAMGLEPWPIHPDAYEPLPEHEL